MRREETMQRSSSSRMIRGNSMHGNPPPGATVLQPIVEERVREVVKERVENRYIEVPQIYYVDKVVEVPREVPEEKIVRVVKPVKKEVIKYVKKPVYVDKIVEVPEIKYVDKIVEVARYSIKEKIIEVPKVLVIERIIPVLKSYRKEQIVYVEPGSQVSRPTPDAHMQNSQQHNELLGRYTIENMIIHLGMHHYTHKGMRYVVAETCFLLLFNQGVMCLCWQIPLGQQSPQGLLQQGQYYMEVGGRSGMLPPLRMPTSDMPSINPQRMEPQHPVGHSNSTHSLRRQERLSYEANLAVRKSQSELPPGNGMVPLLNQSKDPLYMNAMSSIN